MPRSLPVSLPIAIAALGALLFSWSVCAASPVDLVMLMDESATMRKRDPLKLSVDAARLLLELSSHGDGLAVIGFGSRARSLTGSRLVTLSDDWRRSLRAHLLRLGQGETKTDILAALELAERIIPPVGEGSDTSLVILLSDGREPEGDIPVDRLRKLGGVSGYRAKLIEQARRFGARHLPILCVVFGDDADRDLLEELARASGGRCYPDRKKPDLEATDLQQLYTDIYLNSAGRFSHKVTREKLPFDLELGPSARELLALAFPRKIEPRQVGAGRCKSGFVLHHSDGSGPRQQVSPSDEQCSKAWKLARVDEVSQGRWRVDRAPDNDLVDILFVKDVGCQLRIDSPRLAEYRLKVPIPLSAVTVAFDGSPNNGCVAGVRATVSGPGLVVPATVDLRKGPNGLFSGRTPALSSIGEYQAVFVASADSDGSFTNTRQVSFQVKDLKPRRLRMKWVQPADASYPSGGSVPVALSVSAEDGKPLDPDDLQAEASLEQASGSSPVALAGTNGQYSASLPQLSPGACRLVGRAALKSDPQARTAETQTRFEVLPPPPEKIDMSVEPIPGQGTPLPPGKIPFGLRARRADGSPFPAGDLTVDASVSGPDGSPEGGCRLQESAGGSFSGQSPTLGPGRHRVRFRASRATDPRAATAAETEILIGKPRLAVRALSQDGEQPMLAGEPIVVTFGVEKWGFEGLPVLTAAVQVPAGERRVPSVIRLADSTSTGPRWRVSLDGDNDTSELGLYQVEATAVATTAIGPLQATTAYPVPVYLQCDLPQAASVGPERGTSLAVTFTSQFPAPVSIEGREVRVEPDGSDPSGPLPRLRADSARAERGESVQAHLVLTDAAGAAGVPYQAYVTYHLAGSYDGGISWNRPLQLPVEFQLRTRFPWPKVLGWLLALAILLAVKPHFHFCHLRRGEKIYPIGVTTRSLFAGWAGLTVGLGGPAAEVAVTDQEGVPITRLRAGWLLRTSAQRLDGSWESIRSGASVPGRDDGLVFVRGWEPRPKAKPSDGTGVEAEPAPPELPDY